MNESAQVFLNKVKEKIAQGDYDSELGPFKTKEHLYASVKARVDRKLETGGTPLLSDAEIKDAFKDANEVSAISFGIFKKLGIIEKTKEGWVVTPRGEKFLKAVKSY
jgi:hypothetical protein